jgi:hypothetical protein
MKPFSLSKLLVRKLITMDSFRRACGQQKAEDDRFAIVLKAACALIMRKSGPACTVSSTCQSQLFLK